jgi:predicted lipoprotein with Yx(FWY)xxD motif
LQDLNVRSNQLKEARIERTILVAAQQVFALIVVAIMVLTSCKATPTASSTPTPSPTATAPGATPTPSYTVNTSSKAGIGVFLIDGPGMTLYWTTLDSVGKSNVTGSVLANWPVFFVSNIKVPPALNTTDFGSLTRLDGTVQATYKGWPLYHYTGDLAPGNTNGEGVNGVWFAVSPSSSGPAPSPTASPSATPSHTPGASPTPTPTPYSGY